MLSLNRHERLPVFVVDMVLPHTPPGVLHDVFHIGDDLLAICIRLFQIKLHMNH